MSSTAVPTNLEGKPFSENYHRLRAKAQALPVSRDLPRLLDTFKRHNVMILVSETGSGKTTQMPKAILEAGLLESGKKMVLTQNRRLAASECAQRIAEETDSKLGGIVGVRYRGVNRTTSGVTRLEVVTDGTLIKTATSDSGLFAYSVIIIDEAHEHTRPTDLLLGLLKELSVKRPDDLKIIIMSATIDVEQFRSFFPGCAVAIVQGSNHNVDIMYLPEPVDDMVTDIVYLVIQIHLTGCDGDILVFVSGTGMIYKIIEMVELIMDGNDKLAGRFKSDDIGPLDCYPLHSTLSPADQKKAVHSIAPGPRNGNPGRKLIVATNIAETSLTIVGVAHVIDSMKVKASIWNPEDESWALREQNVSKAVASQRSGRAGRTRDGVTYRMCTQTGYHAALSDFTVPEMQNGDMIQEVLDILRMRRHPFTFPYMSAPSTEVIVKALGILSAFDAIRVSSLGLEITKRGVAISRLPANVYHAVMLLESPRFGCQDETLSLVAMLEASEGGRILFIDGHDKDNQTKVQGTRQKFDQASGDHIMLINIYLAYREACRFQKRNSFIQENHLLGSVLKTADSTRQQLLSYLCNEAKDIWIPGCTSPENPRFYTQVLGALASSYFLRVAKRVKPAKEYMKHEPILWETVRHSTMARITKDYCQPRDNCEWIVYEELSTGRDDNKFLRMVTPIPLDLIISAEPAPWSRMNLAAGGNVRDGIVKTIAATGGLTEAFVRQNMPPPSNAQ